jgi:hypothetical protein
MYDKLITEGVVEIDPSKSPATEGKPISAIYEVSFANDRVLVIGKWEGDAEDRTWSTPFTREELPTAEAKELYDQVVTAVNSLHLSIRKSDANFGTDKWLEFVEESD